MVIPVDYAQVNFRYDGPGVPTGAEWTLGLDISELIGTPLALAESIGAIYETVNFDASTAGDVDLVEVQVKYGPDATGPSAIASVEVGGAGAAGAPSNVAYLVRKVTEIGGRAGRGRLYFPGVVEAQVGSDGALDGTWLANFQIAWNNFVTELGEISVTPVLLHGAGSPLSTPTPIVEMIVDAKVATQRRRLRR